MMPSVIEMSPTKRSWPSESSVTLRNVSRQSPGAQNGRMPSRIRSNASAAHSESTPFVAPRCGYFEGGRCERVPPDCLKYWKNSPLGSSTIRSLRPRNVDL